MTASKEPPPLAGGDPVEAVLGRLAWAESERIWPNGLRYLWTDGFGVVLLCSLAEATGEEHHLGRAEDLVGEVDRVLGRSVGYRIGETPDRYGQYFHYLTVWAFALGVLGRRRTGYRERALQLLRGVHPRFVVPGRGIHWKMLEDLSGPEPGFGMGALDPFQALAVYRFIDGGRGELARETAELEALVEQLWEDLVIHQDLGLGMMLWAASWCARDRWALVHRRRSLEVLEAMWVEPAPEGGGYVCRQPGQREVRFAFTNYGVVLGLRAASEWTQRVPRIMECFDAYRSHDEYDREAITHVMGCVARLPGAFLTG
ncbi:MAG: hypothetical protein R2716_08345 [Microthrixaceae bacterium]